MIIIVARLRSQNGLGKNSLSKKKKASQVKKAMPDLLLWGPSTLCAYTSGIYYVLC